MQRIVTNYIEYDEEYDNLMVLNLLVPAYESIVYTYQISDNILVDTLVDETVADWEIQSATTELNMTKEELSKLRSVRVEWEGIENCKITPII